MRTLLGVILVLFVSISQVMAQASHPALPGAETILRNVEHQYAGINDYTVTLEISVNVERLKVPPSKVTMYFKQPDKVHFSAQGFAMVPKQAVAFNFERLQERYDIEKGVEIDTVNGRTEYRLILLPKNDKTKLRRVQLYVDPERWAPDSLRIPSLDGRVMAAGIRNQQVGDRWLPAEVTVTFGTASGDSSVVNVLEEVAPGRRQPPARGGSATIRYSDYRINTGLSDDLFKNETEQQGR